MSKDKLTFFKLGIDNNGVSLDINSQFDDMINMEEVIGGDGIQCLAIIAEKISNALSDVVSNMEGKDDK